MIISAVAEMVANESISTQKQHQKFLKIILDLSVTTIPLT